MSIYFDRAGATTAFTTGWSPGPRAGVVESFEAAFNATRWTDVPTRLQDRMREVYEPIVAQLNGDRPPIQGVWNPYTPLAQPGEEVQRPTLRLSAEREEQVWAAIAAARAADPQAIPAAPADREALWAPVIAEAEAAITRDIELTPRMQGAASIAGFAGQIAAFATDPGTAISLAFGAGAGTSILRAALVEAGIGAAAEATVLPERAALRERLGRELTAEEAALSIAGAGLGAGLAAGALRGIGLGGRRLLEAFERAVPRPTLQQQAARVSVEADTIGAEANPMGRTPAAVNEHAERLLGAMRAAAEGVAPERAGVAPRPVRPVATAQPTPAVMTGPDGMPLTPRTLDPRSIQVDPATFQFKAGGDAEGVLETLIGVRQWDPIRAGIILVWERADGTLFAADGHQRTGLARRLLAEDPDAPIALQAYVLREADGIPAEMARAIAAARNIAEGSGSVVDAAKALRVSPELLANLPPRSALLRTARDLLPLSDDAFGLVVNEVVDARWAAIVGRLIPVDEDGGHVLQDAAMAVLARLDPENANQAEAMVRQAMMSGVTRETQLTLFGAETLARSLFSERAKVLDATVRSLKRDRTLFNTLVSGREAAEAAGNRLATADNARRAMQDAQAIDTLQRLAQRRGPLSDALSAAARAYAEGGRLDRAVATFRDAVRDAVARGDFAGDDIALGGTRLADLGQDGSGGAGRGEPPAAEQLERAEEDLFGQPAGAGQEAQLASLERELRGQLEPEAPPASDAVLRSPVFTPENGQLIATTTTTQRLRAHPAYGAAKGGDAAAAARLVADLVDDTTLEEARARFGSDVTFLPVGAVDPEVGVNAIPTALAVRYADALGAPVSTDVVQVTRAMHTGAQALHRLVSRPAFAGHVEPGRGYVLVDDVAVLGGSLAELGSHIRANGGDVRGVVLLVNQSRAANLAADPAVLRSIDERFGDVLRTELGVDPAALTAAEAGYIDRFRSADALRSRISEAAAEPAGRGGAGGVREGAGSEGLTDPDAGRAFTDSQRGRSLEEVYAGAERNQASLAAAGERIAAELGLEFRNPGIKARATAEGKLERKGYRDAGQMTDIVRAGFVAATPETADAAAARLAQHFEILDEGWVVTPAGYFDRKVLVRFADGQVGEVQLWEPNLLRAKDAGGGHALYEEARRLPAGDPRRAEIQGRMQELYGAAAAQADPGWRDVYSAAAARDVVGSGNVARSASGNIRSNAVSETTRPLSATSAESTSVQSSPGASTANAQRSSTMTAGRASQFTNVRGIEGAPSTSNIGIPDGGVEGRQIPIGEIDQDGAIVARTMSEREIFEEIDADRNFAEQLELCTR